MTITSTKAAFMGVIRDQVKTTAKVGGIKLSKEELEQIVRQQVSRGAQDNEQLRKAMVKHVAYFDRPAHYLRVSILFDSPFWGDQIPGSWFMSEAFGGCCVYNEGSRHDVGKYGVLNWLIPGSDALAFSNLSDQELIDIYAYMQSVPKGPDFKTIPLLSGMQSTASAR